MQQGYITALWCARRKPEINGEEDKSKVLLQDILRKHERWLNEEIGAFPADFSRTTLTRVDLSCTDLREAIFQGTVFIDGDLRYTNFCDADLTSSVFIDTALGYADMRGTNLHNANLITAKGLETIRWDITTQFYSQQCPSEGSFIGYKAARNKIIKLEICADAKRSSATSRKCRCSKAKVLSITNLDGSESGLTEVASYYDENFIYRVGETVEVPDFDENRWNECAAGIHFFITREEAVKYVPV